MKAVIYSRVSTLDQDNQRQVKELQHFAKSHKLQVVKVFEEKVSGATKAKERKGFSELLTFIKQENIKAILIWELARLGRSMLDVQVNIDELSKAGVNIYIKKEGLNTLDENGNVALLSKMMIGMLSAFAEFERDTTKKRSSSGLRQRASLGGAGGGVVKPYGYKNENKFLVVDQEEAKIIQFIFQKYLEGFGTSRIARLLNEKKVPTRYNKAFAGKTVLSRNGYAKEGKNYNWQDGTIYTILKNTIYYGDRKYKKEIFKVPAIISKTTFDLVQAKLKSGYSKPNSEKKYENVLGGLLICPKCGKNYYMHKRANNKDAAFKCISKRYKEYCGNPSINIDKLIKALYWKCQPLILNDSLQSNTDNIKASIENKELELSNVNKDLKKLQGRFKKIQDEYLDERMSKTQYLELIDKTNTDIQQVNDKALAVTKELNGLQHLRDNSNKTYSYGMFKTYLKDAVKCVKVFETPKPERFKDMLRVSNDIPLIVQVESSLVMPEGQSVVYHFALTRYSNNFASVVFDKEMDNSPVEFYSHEIVEGNVHHDTVLDLSELKPLKQLQNKHIRKL